MSNKSKLTVGLILGAISGAVAGLFLSPKTGKENRKIVSKKLLEIKKMLEEKEVDKTLAEIFGNTSKVSREVFLKTKDDLAEKISKLNIALSSIDKTKYTNIVTDVVERIKANHDLPEDILTKLKKYLSEDFKKIQNKYKIVKKSVVLKKTPVVKKKAPAKKVVKKPAKNK